MASSWQRLDDLWYRRVPLATQMKWESKDSDRFLVNLVCAAPCGGPIALVRDERVFQPLGKSIVPKLAVTTALGAPISSIDWTHRGLIAMHWVWGSGHHGRDGPSPERNPVGGGGGEAALAQALGCGPASGGGSEQLCLVCVFETGVVRIFDLFCGMLKTFSILEEHQTSGPQQQNKDALLVAQVSFWQGGIAVLTRSNRLVVNFGFSKRSRAKFADQPLVECGSPGIAMVVLPSGGGSTTTAGGGRATSPALEDSTNFQTTGSPNVRAEGAPSSGAASGGGPTSAAAPASSSRDIRVLVSTERDGVFCCARTRCTASNQTFFREENQWQRDPITAFALSPSSWFLACVAKDGGFQVLDRSLNLLDVADIGSRKKPRELCWVGDDCVALYLSSAGPRGSGVGGGGGERRGNKQHSLFIGGPRNEWIPYSYDDPITLVSEVDGVRIIGEQTEFLQRIPTSVEAIYRRESLLIWCMIFYPHFFNSFAISRVWSFGFALR